MGTSSALPLIVRLLEQFQETRLKKDWAGMRALLHPAARLESLAAVGSVLSADELVAAIRAASSRGLYTVKTWDVEPAGPNIALAVGRVRYETKRGSITDEGRVFVSTETHGLIWRMRIFHDRASAETCVRETALDLGR